ncbi:MAG: hypothetical protein MJA83_10215 [Gammaproteobacteria bacterium]|nr:hypothetical protein [Gammaproteobacteria bacterium]
MSKFQKLKEFCKNHWGLELSKCGGEGCLGRTAGSWKCGWMLGGNFPGTGHAYRRFNTLKAVAKAVGYDTKGVSE